MNRPLQARRDTKAREAKQNRDVRARDGTVCRFERKIKVPLAISAPTGWRQIPAWDECGKYASDTVHIYRRRDCADEWDHEDVAMRGCRDCHNRFDGNMLVRESERYGEVRIPPFREERAWAIVRAACKVLPPRQLPEGVSG